MERSYHWYIGWSLALGSLAATLVGLVLFFAWEQAPARVFHQVREQWQDQPLPRYRLRIMRPLLNCEQDLVIRNERIEPESGDNTCPIRSLTMTSLFDRVARLDGMENTPPPILRNGRCACQSVINATIVYDQVPGVSRELLYPSEVAIADQRVIDWRDESCWMHVVTHGQLPECDVPFFLGQPRITHILVEPLP